MVSATHTHTGPVVSLLPARDRPDGGGGDLARRYTEGLPELIAAAVEQADKKLAPARAAAGVGREEGLSFNRRFFMRDGTVSWNPRKLDPDVVRPAGPTDPDVGLLSLEDPRGRPLATYVNFAMHPDTVGGEGVSADYPGVLARLLAEVKGPGMVTLFANGCCGNLNHLAVGWADAQKGPAEARRIGTAMAGAVCRTYPALRPVPAGGLRVKGEVLRLPLAPVRDEDVARAREVMGRIKDPKTTFLERVKAYQVLDVADRSGEPLEVEVQVVALGDRVAWVSLPGEVFVELGLAIKAASPYPCTLLAELANGSVGYIPDRAAYAQGNYEVVSARCAAGSGETLVATALRLLKEAAGGR
jgi:hypothetical protein